MWTWDLDWGIGIGDQDCRLGLEIWIGEWGLGFGIENWGWGLRIKIGAQDRGLIGEWE